MAQINNAGRIRTIGVDKSNAESHTSRISHKVQVQVFGGGGQQARKPEARSVLTPGSRIV